MSALSLSSQLTPNVVPGTPIYLRNTWYAAMWSTDLGEKPVGRILLEEEIVFFRTSDGTPGALLDRCPHRFVSLHDGKVVEDQLQCPYHGLRFRTDGSCGHNPHSSNGHCPASATIRNYPLVEQDGLIWIWMGDADRADPDAIIRYPELCDPNWTRVTHTFNFHADYQLYTDNLMDLSHTEFIHPALHVPGTLERVTMKAVQEGETVHFIRTAPDEPATGTFQRRMCEELGGKAGDRVHVVHDIRWDVPGNMLVDITQQHGNRSASFNQVHFLCPTRRGQTQLVWASFRNFAVGDQEMTDYLLESIKNLFENEDIPAIESVQGFVQNRDLMSLRPVLLPIDEAPVRARRVLESRIKAERMPENVSAA